MGTIGLSSSPVWWCATMRCQGLIPPSLMNWFQKLLSHRQRAWGKAPLAVMVVVHSEFQNVGVKIYKLKYISPSMHRGPMWSPYVMNPNISFDFCCAKTIFVYMCGYGWGPQVRNQPTLLNRSLWLLRPMRPSSMCHKRKCFTLHSSRMHYSMRTRHRKRQRNLPWVRPMVEKNGIHTNIHLRVQTKMNDVYSVYIQTSTYVRC